MFGRQQTAKYNTKHTKARANITNTYKAKLIAVLNPENTSIASHMRQVADVCSDYLVKYFYEVICVRIPRLCARRSVDTDGSYISDYGLYISSSSPSQK